MAGTTRPGDVSAVVVTMGEPGTSRALDSLRRQTVPLQDVIVVEGVSPFSRALSTGVEQVRTPFFVQVDSDMVLDDSCVERLQEAMEPKIGIAAGLLRDPLMGAVGAVKLFRRECFDAVALPGTVALDVDFYSQLAERGWRTVYVLSHGLESGPPTFGEHSPDYSPWYTYSTYFLLGCKYWHRRDRSGLRWRFRRLRRSTHPMAAVARTAIGHGVFGDESRDVGKEAVRVPGDVLAGLVACDARPVSNGNEVLDDLPAELLSERFYERGRGLGADGDFERLGSCLGRFGGAAWNPDSWAGEVALCHGFVEAAEGDPPILSAWRRLRELR